MAHKFYGSGHLAFLISNTNYALERFYEQVFRISGEMPVFPTDFYCLMMKDIMNNAWPKSEMDGYLSCMHRNYLKNAISQKW